MTGISRRSLLSTGFASLLGGPAFGQAVGDGLGLRPPVKPIPGSGPLIARAALPGEVSYALMDPVTGTMEDEGRAMAPHTPASVLKVMTTLYALDRLGPEHRFRTRVLRAGDMLILAGGGDPVLSTDDLALLASDLVETGQTSPARFAVWGGALPRIEEIAPAQADYLAYNPALSGMILNFNRVHLGWQHNGDGVQMSLQARAAKHSPRAYTIDANSGQQSELFSYRDEDGREIWTVSRAAIGRAGSRWLPVRKPELYAGDVFQTLCRAQGLVLPKPEVIDSLPEAEEIVGHRSAPLNDILRDMLYYSTNLTAEVVGMHASGAEKLRESGAAMVDWLAEQGISEGCRFADHSGLSADSRITADAMVRLLSGPGRKAGLADMLKTNPLDHDLGSDGGRRAEVAAKTGTLNFVSNLAGYMTTPEGRDLAFAILSADGARHVASRGKELPPGVSIWTNSAKKLQRRLINGWAVNFG